MDRRTIDTGVLAERYWSMNDQLLVGQSCFRWSTAVLRQHSFLVAGKGVIQSVYLPNRKKCARLMHQFPTNVRKTTNIILQSKYLCSCFLDLRRVGI